LKHRKMPDRRPRGSGAAPPSTVATWSVESVGARYHPSRPTARRMALILAVAALCLMRGSSPPAGPEKARAPDGVMVWRPADGIGALTAGFGDVWIDDRTRERLLRVDGATGRIQAAIPVDGRLALAASPRAVWALQSGGGFGLGLRGPLLRVDPRTNRVRARIPLRASGRPVLGFGVQAVGRDVWVWGPRDILRVDGRAGRVTSRIAVPESHGELTGVAAGRRQVIAGTADGHLLRFDARTGGRTGVLRVPEASPSPKALSGGRLVFTTPGVVSTFDLAAGRVAWRRRLGFRAGAALGSDGLVWAHSAATHERGDRVTALRPDSGRTVSTRLVPAFGSTGIAVGAGRVSVATAGGALFVVASARD
jgi:outer membrane protein assembly factor BamB